MFSIFQTTFHNYLTSYFIHMIQDSFIHHSSKTTSSNSNISIIHDPYMHHSSTNTKIPKRAWKTCINQWHRKWTWKQWNIMSINQWHKHDKTNQEMNDLSGDRWRWTIDLVWLTTRVSFLVEMKELRWDEDDDERKWMD